MDCQSLGARTLWLPLLRPFWAWVIAGGCGVLYALSATRDLGFYDSPELLLAARVGGLGHPPGQPLHTLLGSLFASCVPWGPVAYRVALLSAVSGGLCVLSAVSLFDATVARCAPSVSNRAYVLSLLTLGVLSQHYSLWEQSTRTEVYALAASLVLWVVARLAHALPDRLRVSTAGWCGGVLGLSACANPVLPLLFGVAALPCWLSSARSGKVGWRHSLAVLMGGLIGLLPYVYVPLAARLPDRFIWGRPDTMAGLKRFLTAADYSANLSVSLGTWLGQWVDWLLYAAVQNFLPLWWVGLAGFAWYAAAGLGRAFPILWWLGSSLYVARNGVWHPEVPDYASYVSPVGFACAAGWAALVAQLSVLKQRWPALLIGVLACAVVALAPPGVLARTRHLDRAARLLTDSLLNRLPQEALLVVESDHWAAPLLYVQAAEARRPDVVVLMAGLASSSWYWRDLYRRHPQLAPFQMHGKGGREGRIRRFVRAQGPRPLFVEHERLGLRFGFTSCPDLLVARVQAVCEPEPVHFRRARSVLRELSSVVAEGAPTTRQVLAALALRHGDLLWRHGLNQAALSAYLSIHPELRGVRLAQAHGPPLRDGSRSWRRAAAIGDPARTLFMAAQLALAEGDTTLAASCLARAAADGLPEARILKLF